ncbi:MAG TPA: gluconate 2-dehydrogenase subunit 3 family protein [Longimicrobiales bacterium]
MDAIAEPAVLAPHRATFRAFACTVVPEAERLDDAGWSEVERTIEGALAHRPAKLRRQLGLLLRAIEALARFRGGRGFSRLDAAARERFIDSLQRSPVLVVRRGIWGLRTLVLMGYYTRDEAMQAVGYRAHPHGWAARRTPP